MKPEVAVLLAGISGGILGIFGQIIGNKMNQKNKINSIIKEQILREKIESFKKVYSITCEIKKGLIEYITTLKKEKDPLNKLILELNNEIFLFSSKKLLKNVKEEIDSIHEIINNPPEIIEIKGKQIKIKGDFNPLIKKIGNFQSKIIKEIKKELNIED